jgi:hypothetical protein
LHTYALPLPMPEISVSLLALGRVYGLRGQRWVRRCVRDVCAQ